MQYFKETGKYLLNEGYHNFSLHRMYNSVLLFFFCVLYCSCSCIVHVIELYFVLVLYSVLVLYLFFYSTVSACVASYTTLAEVFPCFFLSCKASARV
jgi:hypothetical protein